MFNIYEIPPQPMSGESKSARSQVSIGRPKKKKKRLTTRRPIIKSSGVGGSMTRGWHKIRRKRRRRSPPKWTSVRARIQSKGQGGSVESMWNTFNGTLEWYTEPSPRGGLVLFCCKPYIRKRCLLLPYHRTNCGHHTDLGQQRISREVAESLNLCESSILGHMNRAWK